MAPPTTVYDVPDHLLHRIFCLLGTHDAVVRAAAVCTRWRRIASARGHDMCWLFRHNFSTCIGHYHALDPSLFSPPAPGTKKKMKPAAAAQRRGRLVAFVPASPSIEPRHFSLDFLPSGPGGRPWELVDGLGTLLLLANHRRGFFPDLIVCEPITRRFITIQPIPGMKYSRCLGAFLGSRHHNAIAMSSFTVDCVLHDRADGMEAGVSAVTARVYTHRAPPSPPVVRRWKEGWDVSSSSHTTAASTSSCIYLRGAESARYAGGYGGTKFWAIEDDGTILTHCNFSGEFRHFRLRDHVRPGSSLSHSHHRSTTFRFVGSRTGVMLVSIVGDELRVFVNREYNHERVGEWVQERSLRLPEAARGLPGHKESYFRRSAAKIVTAGEGYVVLTPAEETWVFSVEVEHEHARNWLPGEVYPYEMWTRPKVRACVVQCKRRRRGICGGFCKCSG